MAASNTLALDTRTTRAIAIGVWLLTGSNLAFSVTVVLKLGFPSDLEFEYV